jgi:MFS family permease
VWLVSWTSFFTDTASEAVYPIMPLYLTRTLGGTAMAIGVIEGAAEALNSVLKIASGRLSDRWRARKPFVIAGYGLSTLVRPMVALATSWVHVLAVRMTDRVGKGVRTAPRDAMLASWADPATRGYVFGLHRSMDHAGAIAGPLLASVFLWFFPEQFRTLFALTIVPGLIAVAMLVPVPDAPSHRETARLEPEATAVPLGMRFSRYLAVLLVFSLGNSTDAFLLLRLSEVGVGAAWIPVAWAALHVVKAVVSPIGGHLSDRLSRRSIIAVGWLVYAAVYGGFALASRAAALIPLFLAYGVYYGLTEGVEKAVVADLAPAGRHGAAFGAYHAIIGIGALAASLVFAGVWKASGAPAAFALGGALALVSSVLLFALDLSPIMKSPHEENPRHQR